MFTMSKKICAATLGLALLFAATSSASAQSFGERMSTKEKVAYIGGGAAAGALLGGLLGGKKGAIIGGLLGAGGGTGYVYYKNRQDEYRYGRYHDYRSSDYRSSDYRSSAYRGSDYRGYDNQAYDYNRRYDDGDRDDRRFHERGRSGHGFNR